MYLHIGSNQMVDIRGIVAIFKAHPRKTGKSNPLQQYYKKFISLADAEKDDIRCYVVTEECIYGTPISLETIVHRYKQLFKKKEWQI